MGKPIGLTWQILSKLRSRSLTARQQILDTAAGYTPVLRRDPMSSQNKEGGADQDLDDGLGRARNVATWGYVVGILVIGCISFWLVFQMAKERRDFYAISVQHFPVVIGLPLAALAAIFVVLVFKVVSGGKISVSMLGLKFEGAAGPVIMWVICFLAIVLAFNTLWDKAYNGPVSKFINELYQQPTPVIQRR
jgi:hypothetical protein